MRAPLPAGPGKSAPKQPVRKTGKSQLPEKQWLFLFFFLTDSIGYCRACLCAHVSPSRIGKNLVRRWVAQTLGCRKSDLDRNSRDGSVTKAVPRVNRGAGTGHWSKNQLMDLYPVCSDFTISCSRTPLEFNGQTSSALVQKSVDGLVPGLQRLHDLLLQDSFRVQWPDILGLSPHLVCRLSVALEMCRHLDSRISIFNIGCANEHGCLAAGEFDRFVENIRIRVSAQFIRIEITHKRPSVLRGVILAYAPLLLARGVLQEFLHFDPSALHL